MSIDHDEAKCAQIGQRFLEARSILLYMYSKEIDAMLAVRLDEETEGRLERLAARTGRTKTFYARAAIAAHLDDLEDFYLAEDRLRDFREGDAIPLSALKAELGLED
ncbi:TraY domain-containing protein [Sphingomonas sp.]|uniref:type II toxin-antitoxin system RelB family antitoxin n=1 Tax=Sphingomonas sp. TaxID=28214 RepID=UPI0025D0878C|nr:TraY domain-containing protein [Sphingomonas sp.]